MNIASRQLILASASPRRKELLENCGIAFTIISEPIAEVRAEGESPQAMVERLAESKAAAVAARFPEALVLGCDTDVYLGDRVLGKPSDEAEAKELLAFIQGKTHSVWGAFAILCQAENLRIVLSHETRVTIAPMSPATIAAYVATGEPMDKAGAYAAQGRGAQFIQRVDGSYTNVVGLNVCALLQTLRDTGWLHEQ